MPPLRTVFRRYEKKYLISSDKKTELLRLIGNRILPDEYGESTVCNIYFDTPDYRLIRASIEKPVFKEKIRVRSYGIPSKESTVFLEIKRKVNGIVYKRREVLSYNEAIDCLCRGKRLAKSSQIINEIEYMKSFYGFLRPVVSLFYDRTAYYGAEDDELRITFDTNIRFRNVELDLSKGDYGKVILDKSQSVMEIKCLGAMPLWLTGLLDELKIYPASFSKYGKSYIDMMLPSIRKQTLKI